MINDITELLELVNHLDDKFPQIFGYSGLYASKDNNGIFYLEITIMCMESLYREKLQNNIQYREKFAKYLQEYIKLELNKTITVIYVES